MDNSYGFLEKLPDEEKIRDEVSLRSTDCDTWLTTSEVDGAVNHCASVMAANAHVCLSGADTPDGNTVLSSAYAAIGNGPVLRGVYRARKFLRSQGIPVGVRLAPTVRSVAAQIRRGRPCALLVLGPHISSWHWILAFGYIETVNGDIYLRIADGWHKRAHYFRNGHGSRLIFAASFAQKNVE